MPRVSHAPPKYGGCRRPWKHELFGVFYVVLQVLAWRSGYRLFIGRTRTRMSDATGRFSQLRQFVPTLPTLSPYEDLVAGRIALVWFRG
jgi:hypothetical protein